MNKSHRLFEFTVIAGILAIMLFTNIVFSQENVTKISYIGFIDRFENDMAVILLEEWGEEIILPKTLLPPNTQENTHLTIELVPELVPVTP
ncbi:DUF3006 domain-containing protein [Oceanobacillus rekensis]|uniref:DUF3006 domain-containing protein n=1 Tax=Oceanobacillus rekensis TaxID=937927 RepID=UPI000B42F292|nr:DUF3006 domain-containing protein [Oceanobacillus rekensis]